MRYPPVADDEPSRIADASVWQCSIHSPYSAIAPSRSFPKVTDNLREAPDKSYHVSTKFQRAKYARAQSARYTVTDDFGRSRQHLDSAPT